MNVPSSYVGNYGPKTVYVNRSAVEANKRGGNSPVWAVEYEWLGGEVRIAQCYEFVCRGELEGAPHLMVPRPDGVSVYLVVIGAMLMRLDPDPNNVEWLENLERFKRGDN